MAWTLNDYISGNREMYKKMAKKVNKMLEKKGEESIDQLMHYYAAGK